MTDKLLEARCKTCKWWGWPFEGCCNFVGTIHAEKPLTHLEIIVSVNDDTDLQTYLRTGPDFGCIHHQPIKRGTK